MVFEEYLYLLSIDTFYKYCDVDFQLSLTTIVVVVCFIFPTTSAVRYAFWVCGCTGNQSYDKVRPIKKVKSSS